MLSLEDVINKIKSTYSTRVDIVKKHTFKIKEAVLKYEQSAQEDVLQDILSSNGLALSTPTKKVDDAALELLRTVEQLPELKTESHVIEDEGYQEVVDVENPSTFDAYESLRAFNKPILLFGGFTNNDKHRLLEKKTGLSFVWASNEKSGNGDIACQNVCKQLRNGQYVAVIILNELVSHTQSDLIVRAAKCSNTLHAIGKKGGIGTLITALTLFEKQLKEKIIDE